MHNMRSVRAGIQITKTRFAAAATLLLIFAVSFAFAQDTGGFSIYNSPLPAPTGFVNDFANVIDEASKQQLEQKLKDLRDTTNPSVEIAVAVVRTTGDRPISDYSLAVARGWKIGSREDDNPSALLFVAIDDRKYFTQVSRDLEDELPDAVVGSLQRRYLVPEFRQGNYSKGISDTIDAYIARIREAGNAEVAPNVNTAKKSPGGAGIVSGGIGTFGCCLIIFIILIILAASRFGRKKSYNDRDRWGGGGFGGGGMGGSALPWIIGSVIANSGSSSSSSGWGGSSDWGGSSGGSDWGGFGGGGDFGGGGAGGDW
jgi:uncharacterized protein